MNRIWIPNKWDGESVAETVPERHLAIEKRWKHPNRARTTSEKPTENRGADRADIDFGHQRSRILNRMVQGFLLGADRVHSRIGAESRCKLAWLLLILTFSTGFSIDCGWCKPDDSTAQIADWFA